ncbi:MAG: efflux RND transporter periplasmic adaptor subunit [Rhizobacter sp.]|nr:efflux RND transporter periplasmic adaptor subunit [Rhizobacter sp.]
MTLRPASLMLSTLALTLAAAAFLSLAGCSGSAEAQAAPAGAPPAPPVSVAAVVSRKVTELQEFSGRVEAVESAQIRSRVPGTIDAVRFKPGALVKKGEVLFVIDPRSYQAEAARLEAAAASSRAQAELAATELERSKRLMADNAISQRAYDERAAAARQLAANAQADEAALSVAKLNLDYSVVRAPISGRIGKAEVTEGNLVDSSVVLTSIVSIDPVYVSFDGDEATFLHVGAQARQGGQGVKVRMGLANEDGFPREGRLDFVDNRIDPASGTVRMRALLRNADALFTPGLFARVQVGTESAKGEALLINDTAIGTDQNRKYVYVVGADNKAEYRVVELGPLVDGLRVARAGLKPGERIVVNGLQRVRPGAPIAPETVEMTTTAAAAAPVRQ